MGKGNLRLLNLPNFQCYTKFVFSAITGKTRNRIKNFVEFYRQKAYESGKKVALQEPIPNKSGLRLLIVMFKGMNTRWFKAHPLFVTPLLIALAHFILTSVVGQYIAAQLGTQMGHVVAQGLIEAYEKSPQNVQKSDEEAERISQDMKYKNEDIIENWKLPLFLISLPAKALMSPFLKEIKDIWMKMVLSEEISKDQFYKRGIIIGYAANFINSLCVGFLVYVILRISRHYIVKT